MLSTADLALYDRSGRLTAIDEVRIGTPDRLKAPPTYEADTGPGFAPCFESAGVDPSYVSGHAFELLEGGWLSDVIRSEEMTGEFCDDQNWLAKSRFRSAVKGGHIEYEAVV